MTERPRQPAPFAETIEDLLRSGHVVRFHADGWSMHPTIRYGEILMVEPVAHSPLHTGDILLYRRAHAAIAHRLVGMSSSTAGRSTLTLRGDAADCDDSPVGLDQVLGRVVAVERRGRLIRFGRLSRIWSPVFAQALRRVRVMRATLPNVLLHDARRHD